MNSEEIYKAPNSNISKEAETGKPGWILTSLAIILAILNVFMAYKIGSSKMMFGSQLFGYTFGPLFFAFLIISLFQIGKRFRNNRSRVKIFFWTSLIFLISSIGQLAQLPAYNFPQ